MTKKNQKIYPAEGAAKTLVDAFKEVYSGELVNVVTPKLGKKSDKELLEEKHQRIAELSSALHYANKALCKLLTHDNLESIRLAQEAVAMAEAALRDY